MLPMKFQLGDHVVCRIGCQRNFSSGVVQGVIDEEGREEGAGQGQGQMVRLVHVMTDRPNSRLVAVPEDDCHLQRAGPAA